jgi:hypothetical protein
MNQEKKTPSIQEDMTQDVEYSHIMFESLMQDQEIHDMFDRLSEK